LSSSDSVCGVGVRYFHTLLKEFLMKSISMARLNFSTAVVSVLTLVSVSAFAKKNCTDQPKDKWMSEAAFKKKMEDEGFKIKKFKQPGSCYEIYGTDKSGKKVEIYFNPVDGSVSKSE
jgi:hypothetical protein